MADFFDDIVAEMAKNKQDFVKSAEGMIAVRKNLGVNRFNSRFKAIGDTGKFRVLLPPIRDGEIQGRASYSMQVADVTNGDAGDMPVPFQLTTFHAMQMTSGFVLAGLAKSVGDVMKDKKFRRSVGTVWQVNAIESTRKDAKRDWMLEFTLLPEESVIDTEAAIQEMKAEATAPPTNLGFTG